MDIECPVCGWEFVHPVAVKVEPVGGAVVIHVDNHGVIHTTASRSPPTRRLRGVEITTTFECERWHQWDEVRAFHKGQTLVSIQRGPDLQEEE